MRVSFLGLSYVDTYSIIIMLWWCHVHVYCLLVLMLCWMINVATTVTVDCDVPVLGQDVMINPSSSPSTTTVGSMITFYCAKGLTPNHTVSSVCTSEGKWEPDPTQQTCSNTTESFDVPFMPNTGIWWHMLQESSSKSYCPWLCGIFNCRSCKPNDHNNCGCCLCAGIAMYISNHWCTQWDILPCAQNSPSIWEYEPL